MPGPLNLAAPVKLGFLDDLATIIRQNRHPVYNAAGQVIGSYDTLDAACQGKWFLDAGATQPPASQLYVSDFWGRRVPLATQCQRSAKANAGRPSIIYPQAVTPGAAAQAVAASNAAAVQAVDAAQPANVTAADLAERVGQVLNSAAGGSQDPAANAQLGMYALWGGLALVGVALLANPGRR